MPANEKENKVKMSHINLLYRIRHLTLLELLTVLAVFGVVLTWVLGKLF